MSEDPSIVRMFNAQLDASKIKSLSRAGRMALLRGDPLVLSQCRAENAGPHCAPITSFKEAERITPIDMRAEAHALAALGIPVFPCEKGGKRPVGSLAHHGCNDATINPKQIELWWSSGDWNIGIATGGGIVLDIDPRHGGDESLRGLLATNGPLPTTWIANTGGGGGHVYFSRPVNTAVGCSNSGLPPGLDVKGRGGYVIAPPSLHASGRRYEWLNHPADTPLAPMPPWLVALCSRKVGIAAAKPTDFWTRFIRNKVPEGGRNDAVARLAGYLFRLPPHRDVILELIWAWNCTHCDPPLSPAEVARTIESIYQADQKWRAGFR